MVTGQRLVPRHKEVGKEPALCSEYRQPRRAGAEIVQKGPEPDSPLLWDHSDKLIN